MRDKNNNIVWNLLLLETRREKEYKVILPDEKTGDLPEISKSDKGYFVSWPVNPHFTGKSGVCELLRNNYQAFNGCNFI